ncbi:MAG: enoyl-CoA hydratase, partial [Deltaproteobacteria bacterium CG_4_9_14_3_um_filter_51_14]
GPSRCAEILFTGRSYRADDCLTMGLVNHIVDDGVLEEFTYSMAGEIAANAPLAITGTKRALAVIGTYPRLEKGDEDDLDALFLKSLASADIKEARAAFFERRKPRFKGL